MTEPVIVVETPKQTRAEKLHARAAMLLTRINSDTDAYAAIKSELDNSAALENLVVGAVVQVKLGRKFADKDTTRIVAASVIGIREDEDGAKQYKVAHGAGFDADIAVVSAGQIVGFGPVVEETVIA